MATLGSVIGRGTLAARPAAASAGRLYFATDGSGTLYRDNGSSWDSVEGSGSGMANPMTTQGDIIYGGASGAPTRLGIGTAGQVLKVNAGATAPEWGAASGGGAAGYDLDSYSIDGTYGDDFTAASLSGSWTRRNFAAGAETYQLGKNGTYIHIAMTGRAAGDGYFRTAPSGDWTFAMAFVPRLWSVFGWSICVVDSAGTGVGVTVADTGALSICVLGITAYTTYSGSFTGYAAGQSLALNTAYNEHKNWLYLRKSGTNYYGAHSKDGEVWSPETAAFSSAITVDRVGMIVHPQQGITTNATVDVDYFNKIA